MSTNPFDVIVVGSGPAGCHAAYPLVEAGLKVAMIDGGKQGNGILDKAPLENFESIRRNDDNQYKWFIGEKCFVLPVGEGYSISMTGGNRSYVVEGTKEHLPIKTDHLNVLQSLAKGGLGEAWGAVCSFFSDIELETIGLPAKEIKKYYQTIIDRIGVSGQHDEYKLQPVAKPDHHTRSILDAYQKQKNVFDQMKVNISQPILAMLTEDQQDRKATPYHDMDFWIDSGKSIYRPRYTIEKLLEKDNFHYIPNYIVTSFKNEPNSSTIFATSLENKSEKVFKANYTVLAAGPVATIKILLKSFNYYKKEVPFLTKSHVLTPSIHPRTLGKKGDINRYSLCQFMMTDQDSNQIGEKSSTQFYSYKSLLLFQLLDYLPLPKPESLSLLSMIAPSFIIGDTRFPALTNEKNSCQLQESLSGPDTLHIQFHEDRSEEQFKRQAMKRLHKNFRTLGLFPLKTVFLPEGATSHYAGGAPLCHDSNAKLLGVDSSSRLHQDHRVYVADTTSWNMLPATSPTLTIMANANRVACEVLKNFKQ